MFLTQSLIKNASLIPKMAKLHVQFLVILNTISSHAFHKYIFVYLNRGFYKLRMSVPFEVLLMNINVRTTCILKHNLNRFWHKVIYAIEKKNVQKIYWVLEGFQLLKCCT